MPDYPPAINQNDFLDTDTIESSLAKYNAKRSLFSMPSRTRVDTPQIRIEKLEVVSLTTGKKTKKSFIRAPEHPTITSVSKEKRLHFAPVVENLEIRWRFAGSYRLITEATIEIWQRFALVPLWRKTLRWNAGACPQTGTLQFNGVMPTEVSATTPAEQLFPDAEFPEETMTVASSPYKVKMTLTSYPGSRPRWVYLDVLLAGINLEWGPETVIPPSPVIGIPPVERDLTVYRSLTNADQDPFPNLGANLPKGEEQKKIFLSVNQFSTNPAQLVSNGGFDAHFQTWGNGPNMPIFAKPSVLRSDDQAVEAPEALGGAKFAWDWEDATNIPDPQPEAGDLLVINRAKANNFIRESLDYYQEDTLPKGASCHVNRGGKRGPGGAAVFPAQVGLDAVARLNPPAQTFPFSVVTGPLDKRPWASISEIHGAGRYAGKTGVLFSPSRMGGDAYKLHVYFLYPDFKPLINLAESPPVPGLPASTVVASGVFENWRIVPISAYERKAHDPKQIDWQELQRDGAPAYVRFRKMDNSEPATLLDANRYNQAIDQARPNLPWYIQTALLDVQNSNYYVASKFLVTFKRHSTYVNDLPGAAVVANTTLPTLFGDPNRETDPQTGNYFIEPTMMNEVSDYTGLSALKVSWPRALLVDAMQRYFHPRGLGIYILQSINLVNTHDMDPAADNFGVGVNGFGVAFADNSPNNALLVLVGGWEGKTVPHEVGHNMFLNHPRTLLAAADPHDVHQEGGPWCMMGYGFKEKRAYCGFCAFRLRGWSMYHVNPATGLADPTVQTLWPVAAQNRQRIPDPPPLPPPDWMNALPRGCAHPTDDDLQQARGRLRPPV